MPIPTQLGAIKSIFHALDLHDFSDSEIVGAGEAYLFIQTRFKSLRQETFAAVGTFPHLLHRCGYEFEFVDLVLERVRMFLSLERPLEIHETVAATNAIQFLSRKLLELPELSDSLLAYAEEGEEQEQRELAF